MEIFLRNASILLRASQQNVQPDNPLDQLHPFHALLPFALLNGPPVVENVRTLSSSSINSIRV